MSLTYALPLVVLAIASCSPNAPLGTEYQNCTAVNHLNSSSYEGTVFRCVYETETCFVLVGPSKGGISCVSRIFE